MGSCRSLVGPPSLPHEFLGFPYIPGAGDGGLEESDWFTFESDG